MELVTKDKESREAKLLAGRVALVRRVGRLAGELIDHGCAARSFPSVDALLSASGATAPDVVVLELGPGEGCPASVERIRCAFPDAEVIVTEADPAVSQVVQAIRAGAADFLEEPVAWDELVAALSRALERVRLRRENRALVGHLGRGAPPLPLDRHGTAMASVIASARALAASRIPVLIEGESGSGKEVLARWLHALSPRSGGPWIPVGCGSLSRELADSELFGHERGAFTDARERRLGLLEIAACGTLFLDEVSHLPPEVQARLLRFLDSGELRRVGGSDVLQSDARIVAATTRDLRHEVRVGRFREDLLYRIAAGHLRVPPLRERKEEILALIGHFLSSRGVSGSLSTEVLSRMVAYDWPGNVRELRNAIDRLVLAGPLSELTPRDVQAALARPAVVDDAAPDDATLEGLERRHIARVLDASGWNRTEAARRLGISVRSLYSKIRTFRLRPPG